MPDLKTPLLWLLGVALLLALAAAGVERTRRADIQSKFSDYRAQAEEQARKASEDARAEEQRRQAEQTKVVADAKKQAQSAQVAASAARTAGERLREQLASLRSQACGNPAPPPGSPATTTPPDLLADVQRRLDEALQDIAGYADAAAIAGRACEKSYSTLTENK